MQAIVRCHVGTDHSLSAASRPARQRRDRRSGSEDVSSPQRLLQVVTVVPGRAGLAATAFLSPWCGSEGE